MTGLAQTAPADGGGGWAAAPIPRAILPALYGTPAMRLLRRSGHWRWAGLAFAAPLVNVVAVWGLAFARWPVENAGAQAKGHD